jgi:hypothetical protein
MIKWAPSRAGLCLLFLLLGLGVLVFDRHTYKSHSGAEITFSNKVSTVSDGTAVPAVIKELNSKLAKPEVGAGRYAVTADKNLFAADRKAWQPPAPPKPEAESNGEEALVPDKVAPARRDVVLYGTYLAGSVKKAMLHFKRFRKGRMLVAEGEEVKDDEAGGSGRRKSPVYTVLKVEAKNVTLKDERGAEFAVGLYDNKQRRPAKPANKKNIQVEAAVTVAPSSKRGKSANSVKKETAAVSSSLSAKQIRKLTVKEKDALVERGELKKHETPFGSVYKRVQKK